MWDQKKAVGPGGRRIEEKKEKASQKEKRGQPARERGSCRAGERRGEGKRADLGIKGLMAITFGRGCGETVNDVMYHRNHEQKGVR